MITAQDVKSGYGQKREKPHTSVLPYLRAQAAEKEKAAAGNKLAPPRNSKTEPEKTTERDAVELDQYDKARLEILRG